MRFLIPLFVSMFFFTSVGQSYYDDGDGEVGLFLGFSGNYSNPVRLSEKSYNSFYGFGGKVGLSSYSLRGFLGSSFLLSGEMNRMKLKETSAIANVYDIFIGMEKNFFIFKYGGGFGGLKLSMPSKTFDSLGGTTLTELRHENKMIQKCENYWVGIHIPIPTDNDFWNRLNLGYEYRAISADRAWMFWHDLGSGFIMTLCLAIPSAITGELREKSLAGAVFAEIIETGIASALIYADYNRHNFPWKDEKPFRMHRHSISLDFQIVRF